jgi:hypothetical protein
MSVDYVQIPDTPGIAGFVAASDPTGNSQDTEELIAKDAAGAVLHTGVFVQRHGGGKLRLCLGNGQAAASIFEVDANGRVVVLEV